MEGIGTGSTTNLYLFAKVSVYDVVLDDARQVETAPAQREESSPR
jgi:hypothetical protein